MVLLALSHRAAAPQLSLGCLDCLLSPRCAAAAALRGLCSDACPSAQVEAIEYYTKLEEKLKDDYKREKEKVNEKPLGMAFVTFHNETITAM